MNSARFASPTADFDLDVLISRLRKGFLVSVGLALVIHLAVVGLNPFEQAKTKAPRPLAIKFIKREPRLTKPLELRKIPQPKRQLARRQVQLTRARMDQVQATASFNTGSLIAGRVGGSGIRLSGQPSFSNMNSNFEPKLTAAAVTSTRASEHKIDMALEMIDVNSMDTGRYRAMVIQDPNDQQAIKGFVRLATVTSSGFRSGGSIAGQGGYKISGTAITLNTVAIDNLRDILNEFTGLRTEYVGFIGYDDPRLMEVPIIFPIGIPNEGEMEQLARYLMAGGFIYSGFPARGIPDIVGSRWWDEMLEKYGGLVQGRDFWSEPLPDDHPVSSAYFDLSGGRGDRRMTGTFIKGRLVSISGDNFSNRNSGTRGQMSLVNIMIYALTQEGSITQRLMQMVN